MIELVETPRQQASEKDILELEAALGGELPFDYKIFLTQTNGGFSHEYEITFPDWVYEGQTGLGLITWGGLSSEKPFLEMRHVHKAVSPHIPAGLLPFAEATSNHLFLLSVRQSDRGCVFAYDPELDGEESLRQVAASFSDFCDKLRLVRRRGQ